MHSVGYHIKSIDKTNLFFRYWQTSEPKLCICIIHDIGDHSGRYEEWANLFIEKNIAVTAIDFRGHGNASGKRGHAKSFDKLYEDIDVLLEETDKHFPNSKKILYGQGLGGSLALNYYFKRKKCPIDGLIITSPWLKLVNFPSSLSLVLVKLFKFLVPFLPINNSLDIYNISRDNNVVEDYKNDTLVHNNISLQLFFNAYIHGLRISNQGYRVNVPMLLMHGTKDGFTSHKASVHFARDTGKYTTFKSWEEAVHELHNDICKDEVFHFTFNWLCINFLYEFRP